jgi:hypothetical protein
MHRELYNDHFKFCTMLLQPIKTSNVLLSNLEGFQAIKVKRFASRVLLIKSLSYQDTSLSHCMMLKLSPFLSLSSVYLNIY